MNSFARALPFVFFLLMVGFSQAQVDTTWLYYKYLANGTGKVDPSVAGTGAVIDIRLANPSDGNTRYYLQENKTFSFRKAGGVPTDSYYPMAGFTTSTYYTQGNLRKERFGADTHEMNYRLMFPKNYASNPNYPGGYPMIVMIHGFGERANCWGTNCYWTNDTWNPNLNTLDSRDIISVTNSGGALFTIAAGTNLNAYQPNSVVFIRTSLSAYNGIKRIIKISDTTFKLSTSLTSTSTSGIGFSGNATGTIERNSADTYSIISAATGGGSSTIFTTSIPHQYTTNTGSASQVIISNSSVPAYNGTRTITAVTATTFTVSSTNFIGTATADVTRSGVNNLLNNDHSMTHGGRVHQDAINLVPAGMTPDDPAMPTRAFPGFMFYPQNLNGWGAGALGNPNTYDVIRIIRLLIKKYNIDPNRIYIHGLSDGGAGAYKVMRSAPWLFAAALPMSAVDNASIYDYQLFPYVASVPIWTFQGGTDTNPLPANTQAYIQTFRNNGMNVRYTLYPTLGHGTWNAAYAEPDFFTWMRGNNKSNIQVMFGKPEVCGTSGVGVKLVLGQGFLDYQWEKDGEIIAGANTYQYTAMLPGTYRARFSRKSNPGLNDWNRWSDPVIVTESAPAKPTIQANGTTVFPTINPSPYNVVLKSSEKNEKYYWYKNGALVTGGLWTIYPTPRNSSVYDTLSNVFLSSGQAGEYTLVTQSVSGCQSLPSSPVAITNGTPTTITTPTAFAGTAQSPSSIFLTWTDNSPNEKGFEVWRRKAGETVFAFVTLTAEDAVSYLDTNLAAGTTYEYKLRAISNTARSNYAPSNVLTTNVVVTTPGDTTPPTPPQNVTVIFNSISAITLSWEPGTDENGVKQYVVTYGGTSVATGSAQPTYTISGLPINTPYPITVKTEDFSANLSPPSGQIVGTTYVDGLYYEHSTGAWKSLNPTISAANNPTQLPGTPPDTPPINWTTYEFTGKMPTPLANGNPFNVTPKIDDPYGIATQQDFYKIKFDGYLNIPTTQTYQFRTTSEDGSMLFLDGFNPLDVTQGIYLNNDYQHEVRTVAGGDIQLTAGHHRIVVLFFAYVGTQSLTVQYRIKSGSTYGSWITIPPSMLKTGVYTPPTPPVAPTVVAATTLGMTGINLTWLYGGAPADEFEIYRSVSLNGTYSVVGRGTGLAFADNTVQPGKTYYYKLKTVNSNGTSGFSNTANATTIADTESPSMPGTPVWVSKSYTNVAFTWAASTDNLAVAGYEILINGVPTDSSNVASFMATNLAPGTLYNFSVKAFDASGNKSGESGALAVTTNAGVFYYSKAGVGPLNVTTNWGTNPDGTGTAPNFANNGQIYTIANRVSTGLGGPMSISGSVSKIIVPTGTTLDVDNTISAKIEVQGNGVVNLNNASAPEFVNISPASTINFNAYSAIPAGNYGNIILSGTAGNKNFGTGETVIMGNLTAATGIALKGAPSNESHVTIYGDITLAGAPGIVASDNALDLSFAKTGTQNVTLAGMLDLFKISTSPTTNVNFVNGGSAVTINVGSPNGGGLAIANGTTLNLGNNHLVMKNAATLNGNGETGKLAINGSNLNLTSSATQNSNLYFDATLRTAGMVTSNFSGAGKLMIQSPVSISDGLKIKAGEVNSAGNITLMSTASKTAYLQEIEGTGSVTGNVNVQRWISVARKYRYMSSVVANMKVADWQLTMPITGPFTGSNSNSTNPSMFYYVENDGGYKQYPAAGTDNQVTFARGRGYSIFNYNGNAPVTLVMNGNPYQSSVPYTLTPGTGGNDGWNLIGNPYASAIQWNNVTTDWTRSGLSPIVHVPDNTGGSLVFKTYDAGTGLGTLTGGIIAPGQAFWVQAANGSPALTVYEKAKRTNASIFYREGDLPANSFTMKLSNGSLQDNAYVIIGDSYDDSYEPELDGMKLKNGILNLSTRSTDQVKLAFNKLSDSFCEKIIGVTIEDVAPGNYSLSFANVSNLIGVSEVHLTDHFTSTTTPVNDSDSYNFAVTTDAASYGAGRFTLTIWRSELQKNAIATVENLCGGTVATIQLANTQAGVFYYATKPNETNPLTAEVIGTGGIITLNIPVNSLQSGTNSVVIRTGFKGCSNEVLAETPMSFTYTPTPNVTVDQSYFSICQGTPVTLNAEADAGNTFRWYENGALIAGQTSATLNTDLIKNNTTYEVAAVTTNGCEGTRASIMVEAENVPFPFIDFDGQALTLTEPLADNIFVQWYKDQEPLEVYTPYIQPKDEGQYSVLVSYNGCSKISDAFTLAVTAVEPAMNNEVFAAYVYPNPGTYENLYAKIETPATQEVEITMMDMAGRKVYSTQISGSKVRDVHKINFPQDTMPGMYVITIRQGDLLLHRKVVVAFK
ncbi:MAG: T9SS type A sorting domain-containing protein [Cyclobacteriaceae bacterium]